MGNVFRKYQRSTGNEAKKKKRWFSRGVGRLNTNTGRTQGVGGSQPQRNNQDTDQPTERLLPQTEAPESRNQNAVQPAQSPLPQTEVLESSNQNTVKPAERLLPQTEVPESSNQDTVEPPRIPSPPTNAPESNVHRNIIQPTPILSPQTEAPIRQNGRGLETEASFIELCRITANGLLQFENYMRESDYTAIISNSNANGIEELDAIIERLNSQADIEERAQLLVQELEQLATGMIEDIFHFQNGEIEKITKSHLLERKRILDNELEQNMTEQDRLSLSEFERDRIRFRSTLEFPLSFSSLQEASIFVAKRIEQLSRCPRPQQLINAYRTFSANFKDVFVPDILFLKLHAQADEFRNYEFFTLCGIRKFSF